MSPREVARSAGLAQAGSAESRGRRASPLTTLRGVSQVLERGHSRLRPLHVFLGVRDVQVLGGGVFWSFCCWLKKNTTRSDLPEDGQLPSRPRTPPEGKSRAPKQRFATSHRPGAPEKSAAPTENRFPREKTPLYKYQFQQKASCCPLWPQRTDDAVQSQRRDALRESRSGPAKGSSVASRCRQLPLSSPEPGASCHVAGGGRWAEGEDRQRRGAHRAGSAGPGTPREPRKPQLFAPFSFLCDGLDKTECRTGICEIRYLIPKGRRGEAEFSQESDVNNELFLESMRNASKTLRQEACRSPITNKKDFTQNS